LVSFFVVEEAFDPLTGEERVFMQSIPIIKKSFINVGWFSQHSAISFEPSVSGYKLLVD